MDKQGIEKYLTFAIVGALIGGLIGFLLRPHVPVVGQLPFSVVITAGSNLTGVEQLMKSAAETSFGYLMLGTLIGLVGGGVLVETMRLGGPIQLGNRKATRVEAAEAASSGSQACSECGKKVSVFSMHGMAGSAQALAEMMEDRALFCPSCRRIFCTKCGMKVQSSSFVCPGCNGEISFAQ